MERYKEKKPQQQINFCWGLYNTISQVFYFWRFTSTTSLILNPLAWKV
jgi:hypothetical protein